MLQPAPDHQVTQAEALRYVPSTFVTSWVVLHKARRLALPVRQKSSSLRPGIEQHLDGLFPAQEINALGVARERQGMRDERREAEFPFGDES